MRILFVLLLISSSVYTMERSFDRLSRGKLGEFEKFLHAPDSIATAFLARLIRENDEVVKNFAEHQRITIESSQRIIKTLKKQLIAANISINLSLTPEQKSLIFIAFENDDFVVGIELCKKPDLNLLKRLSNGQTIFEVVNGSQMRHVFWWQSLLKRAHEYQTKINAGSNPLLLAISCFATLPEHPLKDIRRNGIIQNLLQIATKEIDQVYNHQFDPHVSSVMGAPLDNLYLHPLRNSLSDVQALLIQNDETLNNWEVYALNQREKKRKYKMDAQKAQAEAQEAKLKNIRWEYELAPRLICSICRLEIENELERSIPSCGNCKQSSYHFKCLFSWANTLGGHFKCPLCSTECNIMTWEHLDGSV